eukprot:7148562-Prymnesium_polylepis.1
MAVGDALDPCEYGSEDALRDTYYERLDDLFEAHKHRFPKYADRTLEWIPALEKPTAGKKATKKLHLIVTTVLATFIAMIAAIYVATGVLAKVATIEALPPTLHSSAWMHMAWASLWTVAFGYNTVLGRKGRWHKQVGYVGLVAMAAVGSSGAALSLEGWRNALYYNDGWSGVANAAWYAFGNIAVVQMSALMAGYGIAAARAKRFTDHERMLAAAHVFIGFALGPRVSAFFFRW